MSNRAQRRRNEREAGKAARSAPVPSSQVNFPVLNVFTKDGQFFCQVTLGSAYLAQFVLPVAEADNFVKECGEVLTEMKTGLKAVHSSSLIVP